MSELLRYFSIIEASIQIDKPTGEDYLEVVFEENNAKQGNQVSTHYTEQWRYSKTTLSSISALQASQAVGSHTNPSRRTTFFSFIKE